MMISDVFPQVRDVLAVTSMVAGAVHQRAPAAMVRPQFITNQHLDN